MWRRPTATAGERERGEEGDPADPRPSANENLTRPGTRSAHPQSLDDLASPPPGVHPHPDAGVLPLRARREGSPSRREPPGDGKPPPPSEAPSRPGGAEARVGAARTSVSVLEAPGGATADAGAAVRAVKWPPSAERGRAAANTDADAHRDHRTRSVAERGRCVPHFTWPSAAPGTHPPAIRSRPRHSPIRRRAAAHIDCERPDRRGKRAPCGMWSILRRLVGRPPNGDSERRRPHEKEASNTSLFGRFLSLGHANVGSEHSLLGVLSSVKIRRPP